MAQIVEFADYNDNLLSSHNNVYSYLLISDAGAKNGSTEVPY